MTLPATLCLREWVHLGCSGGCLCRAGERPRAQVLDGVASLIDKNLLQQAEQDGKEPRLVLLETIREFGLECLTVNGEMEATQQAHANYYLALAEKAEPEFAVPRQAMWLERLDREHENSASSDALVVRASGG